MPPGPGKYAIIGAMFEGLFNRANKRGGDTAVLHLEGVGEVTFRRSNRARRVNISVRPLKGVCVSVPRGVSFERALDMVRPKGEWIKHHLERARQAADRHSDFLEGLPPIDEKEAKKTLADRLQALAAQYGFTYNRLFIRNQRTRWGSCSARNNINLNIKLARLPDPLRDYVLLHELVHTRQKHHRKEFWRELERLMPDARARDRALKAFRLELL